MKNTIKKTFERFGYSIRRVDSSMDMYQSENFRTDVPKFLNRLQNLKQLGFDSSVIIDGGAHIGNWTKKVFDFYPDSKYILIEPNPFLKDKIDNNLRYLNIDYAVFQKALGSEAGKGSLNVWDSVDKNLTGSSLCDHVRGEASKQVECEIITLESILDTLEETPNLTKLDLQGYELNALNGAKKLLEQCEVFIIEFGCLEAYVDRTSIRDLIDLMYDHSYSLYDIIDLHYRPYDNALTGGDFIFIKNSSKLKKYKGWE